MGGRRCRRPRPAPAGRRPTRSPRSIDSRSSWSPGNASSPPNERACHRSRRTWSVIAGAASAVVPRARMIPARPLNRPGCASRTPRSPPGPRPPPRGSPRRRGGRGSGPAPGRCRRCRRRGTAWSASPRRPAGPPAIGDAAAQVLPERRGGVVEQGAVAGALVRARNSSAGPDEPRSSPANGWAPPLIVPTESSTPSDPRPPRSSGPPPRRSGVAGGVGEVREVQADAGQAAEQAESSSLAAASSRQRALEHRRRGRDGRARRARRRRRAGRRRDRRACLAAGRSPGRRASRRASGRWLARWRRARRARRRHRGAPGRPPGPELRPSPGKRRSSRFGVALATIAWASDVRARPRPAASEVSAWPHAPVGRAGSSGRARSSARGRATRADREQRGCGAGVLGRLARVEEEEPGEREEHVEAQAREREAVDVGPGDAARRGEARCPDADAVVVRTGGDLAVDEHDPPVRAGRSRCGVEVADDDAAVVDRLHRGLDALVHGDRPGRVIGDLLRPAAPGPGAGDAAPRAG